MMAGSTSLFVQWRKIRQDLALAVDEFQIAKRQLESGMPEPAVSDEEDGRRAEVEARINVVNAVLKIAAAHTSNKTDHGESYPFDKGKLARMQVQIDPRSREDEYAAQLFHEAYGQLNFLHGQLEAIEREKTARIKEKMQATANLERSIKARSDDALLRYRSTLRSEQFARLLDACGKTKKDGVRRGGMCAIAGKAAVRFPLPSDGEDKFLPCIRGLSSSFIDQGSCSVHLPLAVDLREGGAFAIGFSSDRKNDSLSCVKSLLLQALDALSTAKTLEGVAYVDPNNFSAVPLGELATLTTGITPLIKEVPRTPEDMKDFFYRLGSRLAQLDDRVLSRELPLSSSDVFVFRDYPRAYDQASMGAIGKLVSMARAYRVLVILEVSSCAGGKGSHEEHAREVLQECVLCGEVSVFAGYGVETTDCGVFLPDDAFVNAREVMERLVLISDSNPSLNNAYIERVAMMGEISAAIKGDRSLRDIPIGVAEDGALSCISFEDEQFATFLCGASRSGKSTLLHTILTGVFLTKHPDDVEVWLVDFKMTEFARYVQNTPPHVRYIVLDESPEVVYDLIDRLSEVLAKRQAIFKKNGWTKLSDAQDSGRYMPAILVVIDEFSVMSKIVADSVSSGKDYREKMQLLLAKGAALGFRFVFSSQGFTQGTRGLSEFSKRQIQQRIAMKTEYAEIRETLDLRHAMGEEQRLMEGIAPHYALLRCDVSKGPSGRLQKIHVLFFKDASQQLAFLRERLPEYTPTASYDSSFFPGYIYKQTQVYDGNELVDFGGVRERVFSEIRKAEEASYDKSTMYICAGQPVRMKEFVPVELSSGYAENILFVAPSSKGEAFQSALATMSSSLDCQGVRMKILAMGNTPLLSKRFLRALPNIEFYQGQEGLVNLVEECGRCVGSGTRWVDDSTCREMVVIVNADQAFSCEGGRLASRGIDLIEEPMVAYEARREGEPDILSKLKAGVLEVDKGGLSSETTPRESSKSGDMERIIASLGGGKGVAKDQTEGETLSWTLRDLVERGSKCGLHFMVVVQSIRELENVRVPLNWFGHKVTFKISRDDARAIMPLSEAGVVSELPDNCFRYTNGMGSVTYRPYSHSSLGLFGADIVDEQEYLL